MAEAATGAHLGNALFALHRARPSGRPDRPGDQLDRLGNPCLRAGGSAGQAARLVSPRTTSVDREGGVGLRGPHRTRTTRPRSSRRSARRAYEGRPIARGIAFLRRLQNADGGFELTAGRGSDAQSTAWAIQAFVAARVKPPTGAFRYLAGPTARGRQLSLLAQVRGNTGVGDGTGAACARAEVFPAPLASWPALARRSMRA